MRPTRDLSYRIARDFIGLYNQYDHQGVRHGIIESVESDNVVRTGSAKRPKPSSESPFPIVYSVCGENLE